MPLIPCRDLLPASGEKEDDADGATSPFSPWNGKKGAAAG